MTAARSLAIACALLGSSAGISCSHQGATPETPPAPPLRVRVVPVQRGEMSDVLRVTGETAALSTLRLASPVNGRVAALTVRAGDHLVKDEVAAQVISFENDAALRGFTLLEQTTQLTPAERQAAGPLRKELGVRTIPLRVPFAAVVAERLHNPGELVAQNDVLLEVFDPTSLYVIAQVPADDAARVRPGAPVDVELGEQTVQGEVRAIVTALTPQTLTVPVRIALSVPPQPALLHAAVRCRIRVAHDPNALVIPGSAVTSSRVTRHGTVMVAADGRAQRRAVTFGMRSAARVQVLNGLAEGDLVLTEGQYALPDGTPIDAVQGAGE